MSDEQARMSNLRYKNSEYNYRDTFRFPSVTLPNEQFLLIPRNNEELDAFSYREYSPTLAFFAHSADPEKKRVVDILSPMVSQERKLMIIETDSATDLRDRFNIRAPTLMKIHKGRILSRLLLPLTLDNIQRFIDPPSNARWRSVDHR